MKKLLILGILLCGFQSAYASWDIDNYFLPDIKGRKNEKRLYIGDDDLSTEDSCFHIRVGPNTWVTANTMHRDVTGLYVMEGDLIKSSYFEREIKKQWQCPYCHNWWDIGYACEDQDCPGKYTKTKT